MNPLWTELSEAAQTPLSPAQQEQLSRYLDLLFAANQTMNLTRIIDRPTAEVQHVGDAMTLLRHLPPGAARIADVGSGGGVPGIPLAIARPDAQVHLLEATKKKAAFLQRTAAELGLANVRVLDLRAEEAGRDPKFRESFDAVVARAVGTMNWLAEWCLPLLKKGGVMLAMKGPKAAEELPAAEHAIRLLGGGSPDVRPADLPGTRHHVIVQIRKIGKTPPTYPRLATATRGKPLA